MAQQGTSTPNKETLRYFVSLRSEERSGGRGRAPLHLSKKCASRFYGDVGEVGYDSSAFYCGRCVRH